MESGTEISLAWWWLRLCRRAILPDDQCELSYVLLANGIAIEGEMYNPCPFPLDFFP
ncbi:MAG: hypothetical protein GF315_05685 [candidate division Zixibacteria bacterium]|nr:hypothetical protein [candidate division Zixibacteria bacterium]